MDNSTCYHCGSMYDLRDVPCAFGVGLSHCPDHRVRCTICGAYFCTLGNGDQNIDTPNERSAFVCEECRHAHPEDRTFYGSPD